MPLLTVWCLFLGVVIAVPTGVAQANPVGDPGYNPINPTRLLDTRAAFQVGQYASPWGPGATRTLDITTMPEVPTDAIAVVMNVTTVSPTASSFLSIYPTGDTPNSTATNNFTPTETVVNDLVIAKIGTNGQIEIFNNAGNVDLVIDVVGYHIATGGPGYNPINPKRLLDTRPAFQVGQFSSPWGPGVTRTLDITTMPEVPTDAIAVVMNVTTVSPTASSFLSIYPTGDTPNTTATNNFTPTETVVNDLVIAKIGTNGQIEIFNNAGNVNLVIDVVGYHTATSGTIAGVVTNQGGNAVADISVSAQLGGAGAGLPVQTAADGTYTISGLPADTGYTVSFIDQQGNGYVSQCWDQIGLPCSNATPVAVVAGQTTSGINAELAQGGNIEGHVYDDTGTNPLGGMAICATELTTQLRTCVVSSPSGSYSLPGILVGSYTVEFFDGVNNAYVPECYQDNQLCTSPTVVVVTGGNTTSGIDATLEVGGAITGTILQSGNGQSLPGYSVCAEGAAGVPFCEIAQNDGSYSISGLAADAYTVTFEDVQDPPRFAQECWQDNSGCVNPTPVNIIAGQVVTNIDATVDRGARIQGNVRNADGTIDLPGIDVCAQETTTGLTYCRVTASNGFYIMRDLLAGTYTLTFEDNTGAGYQTECWQDDVGCNSPTLLTVVLGQQVFINPTLEQ